MALRLDTHRPERRKPSSSATMLRWSLRAAMLVAIAVIAVYRGYAPATLLGLGLVVAWAAALPFLLRALAGAVRSREELRGGLGTGLIFVLALVLLAAFAFTARRMLLGFG